ncbi:MAG: PQQ-binding-like beta-propeller repeat protein [Planctomycetaceae bacterium]
MSASATNDGNIGLRSTGTHGHWKFGLAIFVIAWVAQACLWTLWWDNPTHFKMSILFVWPAALFLLLIWWTFFSGWSRAIRYRSVGAGFALIVAFFATFRLERFDGDMTPTRITWRWAPRLDVKSRQYLEQLKMSKPAAAAVEAEAEPLVASEDDWPGFRGPRRDGVLSGVTLRTDWAARPPKEVWRHPVGKAWSSFAIIGDYAFTQEQRDSDEAVVAYRCSDGQQIWQHLDPAQFPAAEPQGGTGPRATPQFSDGKLYTLGATGILNCLEARTGKLIWTTNILVDAGTPDKPVPNLAWGMSGSPLVVDDLVIVNPGGIDGKSVVAYDRTTGNKVWSGGNQVASYSSPTVTTLHGERVVLMPVGTGLAAHSLADGKELWFFKWQNSPLVNSALPLVLKDESILFGTGYGVGSVRLETSRSGPDWTVATKWQTNRFRPKFNDFVVHQDHIYGLDDGRLTCVALETGKTVWQSGRYGYGQFLLVSDTLLIISEEGVLFQVPAKPARPEDPISYPLLDGGITWNHPALVRGKLFVRNANEAACFDLE